MAATNYTPISLYYSTTASAAPTAGNLTSGELAINITDGKLFYKDNSGVVQTIAYKNTPISTLSGFGTGVATALGINTGSAGAFVVNGGALGTPSSGTLTNATGLPVSTGVSGFGTGVAAALGVNTGSAGAFVVNGGALGTPSSGTVTNLTGTASININGTVGATTPAAGTFTSLSDSGNLTFTGTGNRITGDFSNSTISSRVLFQSSTTNGATRVAAIPNGTGSTSALAAINNSDPTNAGWLQMSATSSESQIASTISGAGTYLPMTFYTNGSERMRVTTNGGFSFGASGTAYGTAGQVLTSNGDASPTWTTVSGGATGGGSDQIFQLNGKTVTTSYSIPAGKNAMSVGPITVSSGQTVTVPSGSRWVVL